MTGKIVLITGGTGGIGKATAIGLAALGARVAITGRDPARAERPRPRIRRASGNPAVDAFAADLSSQAEVRRLADEVLDAYPRLDVLVNNVGGFWATRHVTADGLEHTFAVNHLAAFLLTDLLLDRLKASARRASSRCRPAPSRWARSTSMTCRASTEYSGQKAYNQSKLANVMFTYELARRLEGTGVTANALHPGVVNTGVRRRGPGRGLQVRRPAHAAVHEEPRAGRRHVDLPGILAGGRGRHRDVTSPRASPGPRARPSYDVDAAARLWQVSAELTGVRLT